MRKSIVIFEKEKFSQEIIMAYTASIISQGDVFLFENLSDAVSCCKEKNINVLFLSIDGLDINSISKIIEDNPEIKIITMSYQNNCDQIFRLMRKGVFDCLQKPLVESEVVKVLEKIFTFQKNDSKSEAKIISIYSLKGGLGKTSVAVNLSLELAKAIQKKVLLLDFNFGFGDVGTFLNLSPTFDLQFILDNLDKLSREFIFNTLARYKETSLRILTSNYDDETVKNISCEKLSKLINVLKNYFDYIIIDLPQNFDEVTKKTLQISDFVYLVSNLNLQVLNNTQKCLNLLTKNLISYDKIKIIINRSIENDKAIIADIERMLNKKIYWKIPNNYVTQMLAINKGVGISEMNEKSNIAISYKEMAKEVARSAK